MSNNSIDIISTKIVAKNKWTSIISEKFLINKNIFGNYLIVERQPAIMVIPLIKDKKTHYTYLVQQYRHPIKKKVWQFPMGTLDKNISPIEQARNELKEETGLIARNITKIAEYFVDPGLSRQICRIFIANIIIEGGKQNLDETEKGLKVKKFSVDQLNILINKRSFKDSWNYAGLFELNKYLHKNIRKVIFVKKSNYKPL